MKKNTLLGILMIIILPVVYAVSTESTVPAQNANIGESTWNKIATITTTDPVKTFALTGGTITGPGISMQGTQVSVNVMIIPKGADINTYNGKHCLISATVTNNNVVLNGNCDLPAGSYDVYMVGKPAAPGTGQDGTSDPGTTYNTGTAGTKITVTDTSPDGEGDTSSHQSNPATLAVLGGSGSIQPGLDMTVQTETAYCDRIMLTEVHLTPVPTSDPNRFDLVVTNPHSLSYAETIRGAGTAGVTRLYCTAVSLPLGSAVNKQTNFGQRWELSVSTECTIVGTLPVPTGKPAYAAAHAWINGVQNNKQPTASVFKNLNGGYANCPTKGRTRLDMPPPSMPYSGQSDGSAIGMVAVNNSEGSPTWLFVAGIIGIIGLVVLAAFKRS